MLCFSIAILLAVNLSAIGADVPAVTVTTCNTDSVHRLSCDVGVISIQTVLYGRADNFTCSEGKSPQELNNTHCSLDSAEDVVKNWCEGKKVCELSADVFVSDPCSETTKYLQTKYTCRSLIQRVVCEHSLANLQCAAGQVISVYSADYGRHDNTTCSYNLKPSLLENTDCSKPATQVAESCNGENSCTIKASSSVFGDPCYGTYKYLEVAYNCEVA